MPKIRALAVLDRFISLGPKNVLDVGSGKGAAAEYMIEKGIRVVTVDNYYEADCRGDYSEFEFLPAGGIWCSHVLEHCFDVHQTLCKFKRELNPGGILAITVPPMRSKLVGGHLNNFTPGTLIYNLVLAGFNCSEAIVYVDDPGNMSVIVKNSDFYMPAVLVSGVGDLEKLSKYFPCPVFQGIDGKFPNLNW